MHGSQGYLDICEGLLEPLGMSHDDDDFGGPRMATASTPSTTCSSEDDSDTTLRDGTGTSTGKVHLRKHWRIAVSRQPFPHAPTLQFSIALSGVVVVRRMDLGHQQRELDLEIERSCYGQLTQAQAMVQVVGDDAHVLELIQVRKCDSSSDSNVVDVVFDASSSSPSSSASSVETAPRGLLFTEILLSSNVQLTGISVLGDVKVVILEDVFTTLKAPVGALKLAAVGDAKLFVCMNDRESSRGPQQHSNNQNQRQLHLNTQRPTSELRLNALEVSSSGNGSVQLDVAMLSVATHVALNGQGNGRIMIRSSEFFRCYGVLNTALEGTARVAIEAASVIVDEIQVGGAGSASLCVRASDKSHCNRLSVGIAGNVSVDVGLIVCENASLGLAGSPKLLVQVSDRLCVGAVAMDDEGDGFVRVFCGLREPRVIEEAPRGVVSVWQWDRFLATWPMDPPPALAPERVQVLLPGNSFLWRLQDAWEFIKSNFTGATSP